MGGIIFFSFMGIIGVLVVQFLIADAFRDIARSKGHHSDKYFWFCFLFGLPGYLMVVALPDRHRGDPAPDVSNTAPDVTAPSVAENYFGETGGEADALVGAYSLQCKRCTFWQSKSNIACARCGATFTAFVEK